MKIGVFADPHDCSSEVLCRPRLSYEKVRQVMEAFRHPISDRSRALRERRYLSGFWKSEAKRL